MSKTGSGYHRDLLCVTEACVGVGARLAMHFYTLCADAPSVLTHNPLFQFCIGTSPQRNHQEVRVHDQVRGEGRRRVAAVPAVPAGGMQAKKSV